MAVKLSLNKAWLARAGCFKLTGSVKEAKVFP
jgi:hypothetical protein